MIVLKSVVQYSNDNLHLNFCIAHVTISSKHFFHVACHLSPVFWKLKNM